MMSLCFCYFLLLYSSAYYFSEMGSYHIARADLHLSSLPAHLTGAEAANEHHRPGVLSGFVANTGRGSEGRRQPRHLCTCKDC